MSHSHPLPDAMSSSSSSTNSRPAPYQQSYSGHSQHRPSQGGMRNYSYRLEVAQQPVRARMCGEGFGDKDRRPITPPPCIKLKVYDENGQEVNNISDVECNFFVLSVDLWDGNGQHEQNLVMHPSNTSAAALAGTSGNPNSPTNPTGYQNQSWGTSHAPPIDNGHYHHQSEYPPQSGYLYGNSSNYPSGYGGYNAGSSSMHHFNQHDEYSGSPPQGGAHFTRNLIGSLTASAFRLKDDKDQMGIWFVLQDLSVRTEGQFRLKFSFLNLGSPLENGNHRGSGVTLYMGKSKVLTTAMSDPFQVFSAKKFPGMIESTALSKKFAAQGIRIPVRHSGDKNDNDADYPDDD